MQPRPDVWLLSQSSLQGTVSMKPSAAGSSHVHVSKERKKERQNERKKDFSVHDGPSLFLIVQKE